MRRLLAVAAAAGLFCGGQVFGQCSDAFDNVLCVSTITPTQAAQFSATDGQVAGFWSGLSGDYFELVPPDNCLTGACGFSGESDGQVTSHLCLGSSTSVSTKNSQAPLRAGYTRARYCRSPPYS